MQRLKEDRRNRPDEAWYRRFIALAILFRATQKIVREEKFSAYQANIVAYTVAALAWTTAQRIDFELIWRNQAISPELATVIRAWAHEIDSTLRATAGARMPTEWAKREEAWEQIRPRLPGLADPLPPELTGTGSDTTRPTSSSETLTAGDLQPIEQCRAISPERYLEIVSWGHRNGIQKWQLGILNTVTGYAASGWERSPSAKAGSLGDRRQEPFRGGRPAAGRLRQWRRGERATVRRSGAVRSKGLPRMASPVRPAHP